MPGGNKSKKARIDMAKPELPSFLKRMKEQIVANENSERRERSESRRRGRPDLPTDPDDDPTVIKLNDGDLTEAEYKRLKEELDSRFKLSENMKDNRKLDNQELDIDLIMNSRPKNGPSSSTSARGNKSSPPAGRANNQSQIKESVSVARDAPRKTLTYGSSSEEED